ncbi:S-adenosyl-L-methionine-dependent methyltransferase [Neurospora crassa]|nr:S-adenosyl-L-methionine-dependent methyltransferase [Neurospora crassa]
MSEQIPSAVSKDEHRRKPRGPKPPKQKKENPITAAVNSWLQDHTQSISLPTLLSTLDSIQDEGQPKALLLDKAPKRWVIYEPMVLLPSGSFTTTPWPQLLDSLSSNVKSSLWTRILSNITRDGASKVELSRLAVNEGIPLHIADGAAEKNAREEEEEENLLRSPSGLKLLHGDFGPALSPSPAALAPTPQDFEQAFWVSTKQNGITQIWAPRYTMFSRGNVKEKARLLDFHRHRGRAPTVLKGKYALDLYAGIGYFVFSYAKLGMRVLCWEINPWSVEGLRRGAVANKWSVKVFQGEEDLTKKTTAELLQEADAEGVQIVVFLEGNESAGRRVRELREQKRELDVVHVNGGFLPTSEKSWRDSWQAVVGKGVGDGWLHLHENVHVKDIESRRGEIQKLMTRWNEELDDSDGTTTETKAVVEHVELVKTFAPDVWHCVFDVYIKRCCDTGSK